MIVTIKTIIRQSALTNWSFALEKLSVSSKAQTEFTRITINFSIQRVKKPSTAMELCKQKLANLLVLGNTSRLGKLIYEYS
jgi:hypothetical protein